MNDNTIIRIKVPARLYESVKAKLMVKEETSQLQKLEEAKAKIEKMISEAKKVDPKKAAEDKKKADEKKKKEAEAKKKKMEEAKDSEKPTPADIERSKKIVASFNAEREKENRMIAANMAKKKAYHQAKKVADKKKADANKK
jgi:hypothetical protein